MFAVLEIIICIFPRWRQQRNSEHVVEGDHTRDAGGGSMGMECGGKVSTAVLSCELPLTKSLRTEESSLRSAFLKASILCV